MLFAAPSYYKVVGQKSQCYVLLSKSLLFLMWLDILDRCGFIYLAWCFLNIVVFSAFILITVARELASVRKDKPNISLSISSSCCSVELRKFFNPCKAVRVQRKRVCEWVGSLSPPRQGSARDHLWELVWDLLQQHSESWGTDTLNISQLVLGTV